MKAVLKRAAEANGSLFDFSGLQLAVRSTGLPSPSTDFLELFSPALRVTTSALALVLFLMAVLYQGLSIMTGFILSIGDVDLTLQ